MKKDMNHSDQLFYEHLRKVNKIVIGMMLVLVVMVLIFGLFIQKNYFSLGMSIPLIVITGASCWLTFKRRFEFILPYLVAFIMGSNVFNVPEDTVYNIVIITFMISALYLSDRVLIIGGGFTLAAFIVNQFLRLHQPANDFVGNLFMLFIMLFTLVLISNRGNKLIRSTSQGEMKTRDLLNQLHVTMDTVRSSTQQLNNDISSVTYNVGSIKEMSSQISSAVSSVTQGVAEQTHNVIDINQMIGHADKQVEDITNLSQQFATISKAASGTVNDGDSKIQVMDDQIGIINKTISRAHETVVQLSDSMEEIKNFLGNITQIATQTNLLALNAAIEAARAGEHGKGFSVVADEIRKLSVQSSQTVEQISQIIDVIKIKTQSVVEEVAEGTLASAEGEKVVLEVRGHFKAIRSAFGEIGQFVELENVEFHKLLRMLQQIYLASERISSVSEQHAAAAQQLYATIDEQNGSIAHVFQNIHDIKISGNKLQTIIE